MQMFRNNVGGVLLIPAANNLRLAPGEVFDIHTYFPDANYPWEVRQLIKKQALVPANVTEKHLYTSPFSPAAVPNGDFIRKAFFTKDISWTKFLQSSGRDKQILVAASGNKDFLGKVIRDTRLPLEITDLAKARLNVLQSVSSKNLEAANAV